MSEHLPNIQIPNLLYWEIIQAAEENKRTLEEELISRLWQTTILTVALSREEGEEDFLAFCKSILVDGRQKLKPSDLQIEFIRIIESVSFPPSGNSLPKNIENHSEDGSD
jgi:hypothetical protein